MPTSADPNRGPTGRRFKAVLVPLLIACFVAALVFSGCAALDEAAVARTDRLKPAQFYKKRTAGSHFSKGLPARVAGAELA